MFENLKYPAVIMYSDHHIDAIENSVYVVYNPEHIRQTLIVIAKQYEDWDDVTITDDMSLQDICELLKVNQWKKNFFDGHVLVRECEQVPLRVESERESLTGVKNETH